MKTLWLIGALVCCGTFASAQTEHPYDSGNAFLRICSTVEKEQRTVAETQHALECMFYIAGFVQGVEIGNTATKVQKQIQAPMPFCRPDNVENAQLVKIVLKYIRENPEDAHQPTMMVAMWAFQNAFPCPSK
jgi:hypothetical protein